MFMSCLRVLLIKYYIYQSQIKSLYILELMFYRVVSNALRITTNSNPFTSCSLLIEGFKAFHFFKLTLHFKLNQALNWSTGFVLFNFSDKVCSSHKGVLYLINNSKAIFQALSRSYNDLEWRENQSSTWQEEFQFHQHLALSHLNGYSGIQFSLLTGPTTFVTKFKTVLWKVGSDHVVILPYLYLKYLVLT